MGSHLKKNPMALKPISIKEFWGLLILLLDFDGPFQSFDI